MTTFRSSIAIICFIQALGLTAQIDSVVKYDFFGYRNNKIHRLKTGRFLTVYMRDTIEAGTEAKIYEKTEGDLISRTDSFLLIDFSENKTSYFYKDSSKTTTTNARYDEYPGPFITKIPYERINYLEYEPKVTPIFGGIAAISLITALVIAPLASYNFSKQTFNSFKYLSIVKPSLFVFSVGMTINLSFNHRRLNLKPSLTQP
jgi:hypothetical protein